MNSTASVMVQLQARNVHIHGLRLTDKLICALATERIVGKNIPFLPRIFYLIFIFLMLKPVRGASMHSSVKYFLFQKMYFRVKIILHSMQ